MFGPWPALWKNLVRVRGGFPLLLAMGGVVGRLRGEYPWSTVISGLVIMYLLLWGLPALFRLVGRWVLRHAATSGRLIERFVWRPLGLVVAATWRHIFGRTPILRGPGSPTGR
jgi:hypothetical protein